MSNVIFVTALRNVIFKHKFTRKSSQYRHSSMLIGVRQRGQLHPLLCTSLAHDSQKRHQRDACITRCHETHLAKVNTVVGVPASSLVSSFILMLCIVIRASVSSSSSASEWLSLSIFSEPTAWLTARRNCSRVYAWLSNLCIAYLYAFVVCQMNAFLGASDRQTADNSADIWHTVDC